MQLLNDWSAAVKKALNDLEADKRLVPGAKLKQMLVKSIADPHALDEFLEASGRKFSDFVAEIDGIVVQKRGGSDMLVGFPGAEWPVPATSSRSSIPRMQLRDDVYNALTKVTTSGYFYLPDSGQFVEGPVTQPDAVPLPKVVFSDLTSERKRFAEELDDKKVAAELLTSLEHSANPLATFQRAITQANLSGQWHTFKFALMRAKLEKWAKESCLNISPSWYDSSSISEGYGPKAVLMRLADHMTDEEIRHLNVPFRAVEALFNSVNRKA